MHQLGRSKHFSSAQRRERKERKKWGYECFIGLSQVQTEYPAGLWSLLQTKVLTEPITTARVTPAPHSGPMDE